ncbi:MAG: phosphorylase [Acidobacteria bacterium]|nr:phosphorylase [Acidobacteriota bacterium]
MTGATGGHTGCIFCNITEPGREELVLTRGRVSFVILNLYPYSSGHLMVVPNRHAPNLATTTAEEQAELMRLTRHGEMALTEAYAPQGINIGINLGKPAGAGVLDHLHVHLVPRWNGDTNFMTAIGNTRVLPEDLQASAAKLRPIFERLAREEGTAAGAQCAETNI